MIATSVSRDRWDSQCRVLDLSDGATSGRSYSKFCTFMTFSSQLLADHNDQQVVVRISGLK